MTKILIIGDIMGKPGRRGLAQVLPIWKEQYQPDVVIGNVENLAHGRGITNNTIKEMNALGFDAYTSGNHIFDNNAGLAECLENYDHIVRPANYQGDWAGHGYYRFAKNNQQVLLINLSGTIFMPDSISQTAISPFVAFDQIYGEQAQKDDIVIVDLHAETTSEKNAFAWYVDGKASVVYGTHTHVPTADAKVLPQGTAFLTDVGMSGAKDSVIGVEPQAALEAFVGQNKMRLQIPESGTAVVNGFYVEIAEGSSVTVKQLQAEASF
ncbi:MAG: TIGR00282 family metallophosphoesterase [Candidatus Doudnabacteria bacterium]